MQKLYKLLENVGLGIFVNGSYGLLQGEALSANIYIVVGSIYLMYISILYQED